MPTFQPYLFIFMDTVLAEAGGVPLDTLHRDVNAICRCYEAIMPVARRLGVPAPAPKLAGFAYSHVSTLGAEVVFAAGSEPNVRPPLIDVKEIDRLHEPHDYLQVGVIPQRLRVLEELQRKRPDAIPSIGHHFEGPVTTAALLLGEAFFTLPYDDPQRAHRLLAFCTDSAICYARTLLAHLGQPVQAAHPVAICDDFAGMFRPELFEEFVVPYWDRLYRGMQASTRFLHSELLRPGHLPYLAQALINEYDPCSDQFLTPALLRAHCPVPFSLGLQSWHIRDSTPAALQALYRQYAAHHPTTIDFTMQYLAEEEKIAALLEVARELAGETQSGIT